jgi:hypothetical protein
MNANAAGTSTVTPLNNLMSVIPSDAPMPISVGSTRFALGYYVDPNIRDKIVAGKFINLASLLVQDPNHNQLSSTLSIDASGQLVSQPDSQHKITNLDKYTYAFVIYISVYTLAHLEK